MNHMLSTLALAAALISPGAWAAGTASTEGKPPNTLVTTFANGNAGWKGPQGIGGATFLDPAVGKPGPSLHTRFEDFGITFRSRRSMPEVREMALSGPITFGVFANTFDLTFSGAKVSRDLAIEIRDYDSPPEGFPYVSVWCVIGRLDSRFPGWHRMSVTVDDVRATELPPCWGGYGAEDPNTFEPMLPPGRTFADVLAGADEIAFTTLVPGFFFGFTYFDVAIDNIYIRPAP